ncbi:JAB1/MPN domain-containing protein [Hortaea werneckii]|uniref:MPN domain-containing protein n=1 Tax=Hortaea werneckii TaxID=91943 RepID=A0A3M7I8M0_HORWE|nr:JAB1/MPN domain-containing protein [Hortaea werneckii]KAI6831893.1 JAB1/MPN domain-containing protein [Hortaea werneckii]KAI6925041.1 JAB1/MPN domain-containing protein [Hortaea werneckii]KAI6933748.1 JAB1/MPN domain-containing protein [Hortaea werneckii]KAI6967374.1 JAB1/MPN domain-containing protein [Hortaea werneckii]
MAVSRHHAALTRPLSIPEIVAQAQDFEFSTRTTLQQWLKAAKMLLTEAAICEQDGNIQMAYLYLYRHAELVLDNLPKHPDYKDPSAREELAQARKALQKNIRKLEDWKPRIEREFSRYAKALEKREAERQRVLEERQRDERAGILPAKGASRRRESDDGILGDGSQIINATENSQLAVDLAQREIRRRDANKQTTRRAGLSPSEVANRRRGIVVDDSHATEPGYDQADGTREVGRQLYGHRRRESVSNEKTAKRGGDRQAYHYPSVPSREKAMTWTSPPLQPALPLPEKPRHPPARPAKEAFETSAPALPPKHYDSRPSTPSSLQPPSSPPTPAASKYTFQPTATTEGGSPLRTMLLPPSLRSTFLRLAGPNTALNLETCGILCGTIISNALLISHLILPDQTSTPETCDTTAAGDAALFDYCSASSLLVFGWIHTHPSQTCFLSSRDCHTTAGYQVMMPEAIAIVCAPRHEPGWGVFRLTDPPGLPHVLGCTQTGTFHPHAERELYTDALGGAGHVVEGPGLGFEVVDLRKG